MISTGLITLLVIFVVLMSCILLCLFLKIICVKNEDVYMYRRSRIFWKNYNQNS
eukprot:13229.XXX_619742_619900_1 [CDS] Oithona nana genome sequencing.